MGADAGAEVEGVADGGATGGSGDIGRWVAAGVAGLGAEPDGTGATGGAMGLDAGGATGRGEAEGAGAGGGAGALGDAVTGGGVGTDRTGGAVGAGRAAGAGGGTLAAGGSATGALLAWADATGAGPADDADTPAPRSSRLTANTALQTAQRARTPASGTLAGSTR